MSERKRKEKKGQISYLHTKLISAFVQPTLQRRQKQNGLQEKDTTKTKNVRGFEERTPRFNLH